MKRSLLRFLFCIVLYCLFFGSRKRKRSGIRRRAGGGSGPVILRDARPKDKDHDDGKECEEGLEEAAVEAAVGAVTDVDANDKLEYLCDGEEESGSDKVYWQEDAAC